MSSVLIGTLPARLPHRQQSLFSPKYFGEYEALNLRTLVSIFWPTLLQKSKRPAIETN
jgi:hypothetical protein